MIYKYINLHLFLGPNPNQPLSPDYVLQCRTLIESESNSIGLKTKQECLTTLAELRKWAGFQPLEYHSLLTFSNVDLILSSRSTECVQCFGFA